MISDRERRLIVVSNRAPYSFRKIGGKIQPVKSIGGLVTAMEPAVMSRRGAWIAWGTSGRTRKLNMPVALPATNPAYTFYPVPLSADEVSDFYYGFSNSVLWPLCHYFTDNLDIQIPERRAYARVNSRFTDIVLQVAQEEDFIWVHDYQLGLVPGLVRQRLPNARIGFFWHIPFPHVDVFSILPGARGFLEALLGADRIGFHVPDYVENFLKSVETLTSHTVDFENNEVEINGRRVQVGAWPISVDFPYLEGYASKIRYQKKAQKIKDGIFADRIILGVDRLDYTKGILERLYAIDRFFQKRPKYRGKVSFLQIAAPSRSQVGSYRHLKDRIDQVVGDINGKYAQLGWTPVHYFYKGFSFEEVIHLYMAADIALITPLIDGMNLVAKEYVSTRVDNTGVLILSERTGAAKELREAIPVNPYDVENTVDALSNAIKMSRREQRKRMTALRSRVREWDIFRWADDFLSGEPASFS
ncbi:trehalose-6-phosphate synthase [candidate division LCP-89 bacterium B3_LCP]|uniref:Trehalose-6-phosphate synthase n=1 Tax=candidate division LCP-89 bacterium B3_LCP TaxID=2012998 RepID=A0A532UVT1_UNCL8|nr:MAG: trehalose-6-phosphate synthase [candidate division LCP-89 bacterium B3_LCP]